ncbi:MAG: hypothetical protein HZA52_10215 [Planctomycetes bacterium]|nr:hypothetical protein [Planctomycetota bacterium]
MSIKILSDFDGVWTNQAFEAEHVKLYVAAEAARLADIDAERARSDFLHFERAVKSTPERFGWAPDGRITAYVDEDPFCEPNSITSYIDSERDDPRTHVYREAILDSGFATLTAFGDHCFHAATHSFRREHPPALVPRAVLSLEALRRAGAEIVVVSNSPPEKIIGWFREAGVDAGERATHALRVRGSAGKFLLGPKGDSITVGGRKIVVDRPRYAQVIEEERPELVVGDVFSLDLALPHVMRMQGHPAAPRELVLRRHGHTPSWVLDTRADGAIDRIIDDVADLLAVVERRRETQRR